MDIPTGDERTASAAVTVDPHGSFLSVSPPFLDLIGRPVESLAGATLVDYVPPGDRPALRQFLAASADGSRPPIGLLTHVFDAAGEWAPCEVTHRGGTADRIVVQLRADRSLSADRQPPSAYADTGSRPVDDRIRALPNEDDVAAERAERVDDFPYDDTPEHLAYIATLPDSEVAERRAAVRNAAGNSGTPMLEIDDRGRTVYVAGNWHELEAASGTDDDADRDTRSGRLVTGADVFERLLERSASADGVLQAIDDACRRSIHGRHPLAVGGLPPRWIQVVPIPSPHRAAATHALVAILTESQLRD